jgi:hypothetical protein
MSRTEPPLLPPPASALAASERTVRCTLNQTEPLPRSGRWRADPQRRVSCSHIYMTTSCAEPRDEGAVTNEPGVLAGTRPWPRVTLAPARPRCPRTPAERRLSQGLPLGTVDPGCLRTTGSVGRTLPASSNSTARITAHESFTQSTSPTAGGHGWNGFPVAVVHSSRRLSR